MKKNIIKGMALGLALTSVLAIGGTSAFAAANETAKINSVPLFDVVSLQKAGTIDQKTADKMNEYVKNVEQVTDEELAQIDAMDVRDLETYFKAHKNKFSATPFSNMIEAGVLTQEQADAINQTIPAPSFNMNDGKVQVK